ncbi:MAG: hypothetical protein U0U70_08755 [Chitinophagaceae bacterium]
MKTPSNSRPILSQTENNITLWIGHLTNESNDRLAGQTFFCPSDGLLNNIQVYSAAVTQPGEVALSLHEFDPASKTWGPPLSHSVLTIDKNDTSKWLRFELEPVQLNKNASYAFRLQTEKGIIGFGEAISHAHKPFTFGQAWSSDTGRKGERFFSYFSLAFKVEMCA